MAKYNPRRAERAARAQQRRNQRPMLCPTHGSVPWRGTVACTACGRVSVMLTEGETLREGDVAAEPICPCGATHIDTTNIKNGTAKVICEFCYQAKRTQQAHAPS